MVNGSASLSFSGEEPFGVCRHLPQVDQPLFATLFAQRHPMLEASLLILCPEDNSSKGQSIQVNVRAAQSQNRPDPLAGGGLILSSPSPHGQHRSRTPPARNRSTWPTCAATASPIGCARAGGKAGRTGRCAGAWDRSHRAGAEKERVLRRVRYPDPGSGRGPSVSIERDPKGFCSRARV